MTDSGRDMSDHPIPLGSPAQVVRHLARGLDDREKQVALQALRARLFSGDLADDGARAAWLQELCCAALLDTSLDAAGMVTIYSFLVSRLYPDIRAELSQGARLTVLEALELVLSTLEDEVPRSVDRCGGLKRLRALVLSRHGRELTNTVHHDAARHKLLEAVGILEELVRAEPNSAQLRCSLASALDRVGHLEKESSATAAFSWFDRAATIRAQLLDDDADNPVLMDLLGTSYCLLADAADHVNHESPDPRCLGWYLDSYRLYRRAAARCPERGDFRLSLLTLYDRLGSLRLRNGRPDRALIWFTKAYKAARRHHDEEPKSRLRLDTYWVACNWLGRTYAALGQPAVACDYLARGLGLAEQLFSWDRDDIRCTGILATACLHLAGELEETDAREAGHLYGRSFALTDPPLRDGLCSIDFCRLALAALAGLERVGCELTLMADVRFISRKAELENLLARLWG